ncbi:MAG: 2-C-methyl-D-erythritol 4-phosphate cytidylyltransferase [Acidobacteria bacterium]|nr:2-C-methyl-D-erythritol 4-phosphate cytidylyltransferase [Acidobacteriota bacterium]
MRCAAIIPAAGSGTRFGSDTPKQFLPLGDRPLIAHTVGRFHRFSGVERIVVCVSAAHLATMQAIVDRFRWGNVKIVRGGESRQESVLRGAESLSRAGLGDDAVVAAHDAVRPFVSSELFEHLLAALDDADGAIPATTPTDTIHRIFNGLVVETPDRSLLAAAQTPQCFRLGALRSALERAIEQGWPATDEAAAVARCGGKVRVVEGDPRNIKITRPSDFEAAARELANWSDE